MREKRLPLSSGGQLATIQDWNKLPRWVRLAPSLSSLFPSRSLSVLQPQTHHQYGIGQNWNMEQTSTRISSPFLEFSKLISPSFADNYLFHKEETRVYSKTILIFHYEGFSNAYFMASLFCQWPLVAFSEEQFTNQKRSKVAQIRRRARYLSSLMFSKLRSDTLDFEMIITPSKNQVSQFKEFLIRGSMAIGPQRYSQGGGFSTKSDHLPSEIGKSVWNKRLLERYKCQDSALNALE